MAATRQIKRKLADIEEQLAQAAPKLAAWSSVLALSSSEVPKLEQLQMSGREIEEAGVSSYSYTDPSEVPARLKLLSTLPQLEQELNQVQVQWQHNKKIKEKTSKGRQTSTTAEDFEKGNGRGS